MAVRQSEDEAWPPSPGWQAGVQRRSDPDESGQAEEQFEVQELFE